MPIEAAMIDHGHGPAIWYGDFDRKCLVAGIKDAEVFRSPGPEFHLKFDRLPVKTAEMEVLEIVAKLEDKGLFPARIELHAGMRRGAVESLKSSFDYLGLGRAGIDVVPAVNGPSLAGDSVIHFA